MDICTINQKISDLQSKIDFIKAQKKLHKELQQKKMIGHVNLSESNQDLKLSGNTVGSYGKDQ